MQAPPSATAPPEVEQLLYTPKEAAKIVSLSHYWLVKNAREGRIPHHKLGRIYRFSRENLDAIKSMSAQPIRRARRSA